jgi:hypothetical protein
VGTETFAEFDRGRRRPGEHDVSGVLERGAQQADRACRFEPHRPPRFAAQSAQS